MAEIAPSMALECAECDWRPPEDQEMQVVADHFEAKHPGRDLRLNLRAVCECGKSMQHMSSEVVGQFINGEGEMTNKVNDRFWCPFDNNFGTVRREAPAVEEKP